MLFGFSPVEFFCNVLYYCEFFVFINSVLTKRFNRWATYIVELAAVVLLLAISGLMPKMSMVRVFTLPVFLMIFNLLVFRDKPLRSIFVAWIIMIVIMSVEYLGVAAYFPSEVLELRFSEVPVREQIVAWGTMMVSAGVCYWLLSLAMNRVRNRFGVREMLMYTFFPLSQIILMYGWMNAMRISGQANDHGLAVLAVLVLCLVADVGLFSSMFRVSRQMELETENNLLVRQIEAQLSHYTELTQQYESIRRMRHDITKHINAMGALLSAGRSEEAAAYVSELQSRNYDATLGICEHPVIDAFLHNAIRSAKAAWVDIHASVSIPADIPISATDLVCTFGNLLDNAVEASVGRGGAEVQVRSYVAGDYLVITTENHLPVETGAKRTHIPGLERGVGQRVLKDLAEKYNGDFHTEVKDGLFRVEITYGLGER